MPEPSCHHLRWNHCLVFPNEHNHSCQISDSDSYNKKPSLRAVFLYIGPNIKRFAPFYKAENAHGSEVLSKGIGKRAINSVLRCNAIY